MLHDETHMISEIGIKWPKPMSSTVTSQQQNSPGKENCSMDPFWNCILKALLRVSSKT